jgi:hypothetical protein
MPDLNFEVEGAEPLAHAAAPQLVFKLAIRDALAGEGGVISSVALRCQIRIDPMRRRYGAQEQERLLDLFGEPARWGSTLRSLLWTHTGMIVPAFAGRTTVELPVPCSYDFNIASTKYFYALEEGEAPLSLLFSGTVFHAEEDGGPLRASPISWEKETGFRLPVRVWKAMMELYYPNSAWLNLRRDVFDRLYRYRSRHGLPTWEQAIERLLDSEADIDPASVRARGEP